MKNPIIEGLKILSLPFVPFIMLWIKFYTVIAYALTTVAHILTFGKYPVSRNPLLVLFAIPLIQIILFPSLFIMLIKGFPKEEALAKTFEEKVFNKYEEAEDYSNYSTLVLE